MQSQRNMPLLPFGARELDSVRLVQLVSLKYGCVCPPVWSFHIPLPETPYTCLRTSSSWFSGWLVSWRIVLWIDMSYNTYLPYEIARRVKKFVSNFRSKLRRWMSIYVCEVRAASKLIERLCRDCFYRLYLYPEEKWEVGCRRGAMSWSVASDTTYSFAPPTVSQALRQRKNRKKNMAFARNKGPPPRGVI